MLPMLQLLKTEIIEDHSCDQCAGVLGVEGLGFRVCNIGIMENTMETTMGLGL